MRKLTYFVMALALVLGFTQCKKEQIEPQGGKVNITLNVENGASTGSATDGSKVNVNPNSSPMVTFGNGDRILVAYDGKYVGYLVHNGSNFSGTISASGDNTKPLYFYFLGNCVDVSGLTAGTTTSCTANISDQTNYPHLPVISMAPSDQTYPSDGNQYTASLHNKCSLMKFKVNTPSNQPICITGMNNKVIINFSEAANDGANNGFTYDKDGDGIIKLKGYSGVPAQKWAIVLPQPALSAGADGTAYTNEENQRYKGNRPALDAISSNQFLDSGVSLDVNTEDNSSTVDLSKLVYHYRAKDGEILTGTLAGNYKISIANNATVRLSDATINGVNNSSCSWAGLSCLGGATIDLADGTINTVRGFYENFPGIHIPEGNTLTIQGTGTLDVSNNGDGAGIGGGWVDDCGNILIKNGIINATGSRMAAGIGSGFRRSCGFIEIQGGTITATGGSSAAGIGTGGGEDGHPEMWYGNEFYEPSTPAEPSSCGAIIISGGTVVATGGDHAAGIGTGQIGNCGNITITDGVTRVTATKGGSAQHSIGTGHNG